ncbi:MAG: hypothetical protein BWK76_22075 [Desulfobulbaceae bacterium A2]|nr:MAG: hypothetical protein BWK76_22075 [Desulfobulbaceae bacterium A2]
MILSLLRGRIPGQVVIQYTDRCNAACPQCGMRRTESFPRATLGPDNARRVIDAAAARGVKALSLTGGEPLLHLDEVIALIDHAAAAGIPFIRTGTNGFLFMGSERPGRISSSASIPWPGVWPAPGCPPSGSASIPPCPRSTRPCAACRG